MFILHWQSTLVIVYAYSPTWWPVQISHCWPVATWLGMLLPGKSHFQVERCNSQVLIETLNYARVRTFYRHDRRRIAGRGLKGGCDRRLAPEAGHKKSTGPPSDMARRSADIVGGQCMKRWGWPSRAMQTFTDMGRFPLYVWKLPKCEGTFDVCSNAAVNSDLSCFL